MPSPLRAAADVGLRTARMRAAGRHAGTRAVVGAIGSAPGSSSESLLDRLTTALTGTFLDPATRMGMPPQAPPEWRATPDGETKYTFYAEGVNAGFVRGTLFGGVVAAALAAIAWRLRRRTR